MRKSNFDFLEKSWPQIAEFGRSAERDLYENPTHTIGDLRKFSEKIVEAVLEKERVELPKGQNFFSNLKLAEYSKLIPNEILDIIHELRKHGNKAQHDHYKAQELAKELLIKAHVLGRWFVETYDPNNSSWQKFDFSLVKNHEKATLVQLQDMELAIQNRLKSINQDLDEVKAKAKYAEVNKKVTQNFEAKIQTLSQELRSELLNLKKPPSLENYQSMQKQRELEKRLHRYESNISRLNQEIQKMNQMQRQYQADRVSQRMPNTAATNTADKINWKTVLAGVAIILLMGFMGIYYWQHQSDITPDLAVKPAEQTSGDSNSVENNPAPYQEVGRPETQLGTMPGAEPEDLLEEQKLDEAEELEQEPPPNNQEDNKPNYEPNNELNNQRNSSSQPANSQNLLADPHNLFVGSKASENDQSQSEPSLNEVNIGSKYKVETLLSSMDKGIVDGPLGRYKVGNIINYTLDGSDNIYFIEFYERVFYIRKQDATTKAVETIKTIDGDFAIHEHARMSNDVFNPQVIKYHNGSIYIAGSYIDQQFSTYYAAPALFRISNYDVHLLAYEPFSVSNSPGMIFDHGQIIFDGEDIYIYSGGNITGTRYTLAGLYKKEDDKLVVNGYSSTGRDSTFPTIRGAAAFISQGDYFYLMSERYTNTNERKLMRIGKYNRTIEEIKGINRNLQGVVAHEGSFYVSSDSNVYKMGIDGSFDLFIDGSMLVYNGEREIDYLRMLEFASDRGLVFYDRSMNAIRKIYLN